MFNKLNSISQKLSPGMRKVAGNIGWLFIERILTMVITFAVGVYLIRYLGSEDFGILSYGISFVALFGSIASVGLKQITVRNLVREESATSEILGTVLLLRIIGTAIAIIATIAAAFAFNLDLQTRLIVIILSFQLLFVAVDNTIELWFQSQVLAGKVTIVQIAQIIFAAVSKLILIWQRLPLLAFAWTLLAASAFKVVGTIWIYARQGKSIRDWKISTRRGKDMLSDSWPIIFSAIAITLYMKIDQVMLGNMAGVVAVGNYAAAVRFSEIWYFIPVAVCSSVFPGIIRAKTRSRREYYQKLQQLFDFMSWIALSLAIVMNFISTPLIETLLGAEYAEAGDILALHIWSGIFVFLSVARGQWLIEENMTRFSSVSTGLGALSNILLNLVLIPIYGGKGAAIATLISYAISSYICCIVYPPTAKTGGWMLTKALLVPFRWQQNLAYLQQIRKYLD